MQSTIFSILARPITNRFNLSSRNLSKPIVNAIIPKPIWLRLEKEKKVNLQKIINGIQENLSSNMSQQNYFKITQQLQAELDHLEQLPEYQIQLDAQILNNLLNLFWQGKLYYFLKKQSSEYRRIVYSLDQICLQTIKRKYQDLAELSKLDFSIFCSLVYTTSQLKLNASLNYSQLVFFKNRYFSNDENLDFDTLLNLLYYVYSFPENTSQVLEVKMNLFVRLQNQLQLMNNIQQIERLPHLLSIMQRANNEALNNLQPVIKNIFGVLTTLLVQIDTQAFKTYFPTSKDLVTTLISYVKLMQISKKKTKPKITIFQQETPKKELSHQQPNEENLKFVKNLLLVLQQDRLHNVKDYQLFNLTSCLAQLQSLDIVETHPVLQIINTIVENIKKLLIIQQNIGVKYQISIVYEFYFHLQNQSKYSLMQLNNLLFQMKFKEMTDFDLIQFCSCLRKFQRPDEIYYSKLDEVYDEIKLRKSTIVQDMQTKKRFLNWLDNQIEFVLYKKDPNQIEIRYKERLEALKAIINTDI